MGRKCLHLHITLHLPRLRASLLWCDPLEMTMVGWLARGLLILAGIVTGWFISRDAPNLCRTGNDRSDTDGFGRMLAFWPARWTHLLDRLLKLSKQIPGSVRMRLQKRVISCS
jgi:hypothetical protein